jgi:sugar diacid utilization regulator
MPILSQGEHIGYILIGVEDQNAELTDMGKIKIEKLSVVASYELIKQNERQLYMRNYYNMFWRRYLQDQVSLEEILAFITGSKKNIAPKNYLAIVQVQDSNKILFNIYNRRFKLFLELLQDRLPNFQQTVLFENGNEILLLIPDIVTDLLAYIHNLERIFVEVFENLDYRIGVSSLIDIEQGSVAYREATWALKVISGDLSVKYCFYDDLGLLKFFVEHGITDRRYFDQFIKTYLDPLLQYDKNRNADLTKTLTLYLHNIMSLNKTADMLFIHKNSLLARLKRIETVLNIDLDNFSDILNVSNALIIYHAFSKIDH